MHEGSFQICRVSSPDAVYMERAAAFPFVSLLVLAESGTGKELVARQYHSAAGRKGRFVVVNCAAIPESLLESTLFGHVKGAFTGAAKDHPGLLELADRGTVYLDEIGDLPLALQPKILRFLQEGEVQRVGAESARKVDAQIVAATNRDLPAMVRDRTFREDLFYRLKQVVIHLPPLRERGDDKLLLAHRFLKYVNEQTGETKHFSREAEEFIQNHSWPGNIRELENAVKSAVVFVPHGDVIELEHLKRAIAFDLLPGKESPLEPPREPEPPGAAPISTIPESRKALDTPAPSTKQQATVAERRRQIAEYIRQHDSVTPSELRSVFNLKTTTLNDDIRALEKEGTIKRMGRTRAVRYKTAVPDQNTTKAPTAPTQPTFPVVQPQSTSSSPPEQILDYLDEHSHASPAELKAALGKSSATVYRALCEAHRRRICGAQRMGEGQPVRARGGRR
jgi:transcriptional regulator with GAF, ATPase, and Fis domain